MSRSPAPHPTGAAASPPRRNTMWVAFKTCDGWPPVEEKPIAAGTIEIPCPHCGRAFPPVQAARIVEP